MQTGSIAKWLLKEGDEFQAGSAICEVETDKAVVTYEATEEGYIAKILVDKGEIKVTISVFKLMNCEGRTTNHGHCRKSE